MTNVFGLFSTGEPSFWQEFWQSVEKHYFSVENRVYENIDINSNSFVSLQVIIIGIFIGIIVAAFFASYDKNRLGGFVRRVISEECLSPERAKTLAELGYLKNPGVRGSLKRGTVLSKVVKCVEREEHERSVERSRAEYIEKNGNDKGFFEPRFELDLHTAHFYIPDEEHYRAEVRFEHKGSGWRSILLTVILAVIGAVAVCFFLPEILQLIDNMIGILKGNGGAVS